MVTRVSIKAQVYEYLKKAIIKGDLKPGQIYSEKMFADELEVSRTPVREAILQLKHENMVEIYNNKGIEIKPISLDDIRQMIQTRIAIEGYSIRYLTERINTPEGQKLMSFLEGCLKGYNNSQDENALHYEFMKIDIKFHGAMVDFTKNQYLAQTIDLMRSRLEMATVDSLTSEERHQRALAEHQEILKWIKAGEADKAVAAFEYHMKVTEEILNQHVTA